MFVNSFLASGDMLTADNLCKQFGSKLFDTPIMFLNILIEKVILSLADTKNHH